MQATLGLSRDGKFKISIYLHILNNIHKVMIYFYMVTLTLTLPGEYPPSKGKHHTEHSGEMLGSAKTPATRLLLMHGRSS